MEQENDCIKNYTIAVKKRGDDITFLRRIVRGPADDSYGIEVAKLAGIPDAVVSRAKEILHGLESEEGGPPRRRAAGGRDPPRRAGKGRRRPRPDGGPGQEQE